MGAPSGKFAPIAHLAEDGREHALDDHLESVGSLARGFAAKWGAGELGEAAGVLHDLGKYAADFQSYIRSGSRTLIERRDAHVEPETSETPSPGRVDHSSAGAVLAGCWGLPGKLLEFVIAGHHAGLADRVSLQTRLENKANRLAQALAGSPPENLVKRRALASPFTPADGHRRVEFFIRMLFSALCDADFLDTEGFFDPSKTAARTEARSPSLDTLLARLTGFIDRKESESHPSEVNRVRKEVRREAVVAAAWSPGAFTLTVPTGGGKTLTGMEFAIRHAISNHLQRVVVAIPYTSIIEQNADEYRAALGDTAVLEHHSSFDPQRETALSRLASENWDVPVVVTTTVQLFESLFARRPSRCRKLHNLARSVILLDEAQTMPPALLEPTVEVLGDLVSNYGSSLVISTATQPALGRDSLTFGLAGVREIVPPEKVRAFERLRRVDVRWPTSFDPTPYEALANDLVATRRALAITHLRKDARHLTELLDERLGDRSTVHLSALMCPEHRTRVLADIRQRLRGDGEVRVVSTQLVEAGVDLDFPVVFRALAGLDSLAQAAGRCNREGNLERGELRVFVPETEPPQGVLRQARAIAERMLRADPALDLSSAAPHRDFFKHLYSAVKTDAKGIQAARERLNFKEVAEAYQLIEDDWSEPVVVPYGRAPELLESLARFGPSRDRLRALGRFSVNVEKKLVSEWIKTGAATRDSETGVTHLAGNVTAYDDRFGLLSARVARVDPHAFIVDG